jgi:penicillin-binding protein-related factor A (putative recombinase)
MAGSCHGVTPMGLKSQAFGSLFEDLFSLRCRSIPGMATTRFPDGCRVVGKNTMIRVKTPCDWVLTFGGVTALIDTKTVAGDAFPFSMIQKHQVIEMLNHQVNGARAGYVIWFRKSDDVLFCSASLLAALIGKTGSIRGPGGGSSYLGKSKDFQPERLFGIN